MTNSCFEDGGTLLCPAYKAIPGAQLIGIVQADGVVAFLGRPLPIDEQFVRISMSGRPPEVRFRFAHRCAEGGCANWDRAHCEIAKRVCETNLSTLGELPNCGIRTHCRWFHQQGPDACAACPDLVRGAD